MNNQNDCSSSSQIRPNELKDIVSQLNKTIIEQSKVVAKLQQEITLKNAQESSASKSLEEPVEPLMLNHVILKEVFSYLSIPSLKNARKVCAKWNEIAISQQPPQLTLNIDKFLDRNSSAYDKKLKKIVTVLPINVQQLEKKLTRRIKFDYCLSWEGGGNDKKRIGFKKVSKIIGKHVENIQFEGPQFEVDVPPMLCDLLKHYIFPNLVSISGDFTMTKLPVDTHLKFCLLCRLKTINIQGVDQRFLQALIHAAPNLECLILRDNIIELPENTTLKSLEFRSNYLTKGELQEIVILLKSCSHSLTSLTLLTDCMDDGGEIFENPLILPKFPLLTHLKLSGEFHRDFGYEISNFKPNNLPNLVSFCLLDFDELEYIHFLVLKQDFEIANLKYLVLGGVYASKDLIPSVGKYFPNLKNFEVSVQCDDDECMEGEILKELFESIEVMDLNNLNNLKICVPHPFNLSILINLLKNHHSLIFKGLKTFKLTSYITKGKSRKYSNELWKLSEELAEDFKKILLNVKEFEGLEVCFHNLKFGAVNGYEFMKLICDNKIPVKFTYDSTRHPS